MKVIKMIDHYNGLAEGKVYCVHSIGGENSGMQMITYDWVIDENGVVMNNVAIESKRFVDVVGGVNSGNQTFYNSELVMKLDDIEKAIQSAASAANGGSYDYQIEQHQREQAQAARDAANYQMSSMTMMTEMQEYFKEMKDNMVDDRMDKMDREAKEQQDRLDKEIQITPYTEEEKTDFYLRRGLENIVKMKVTHKKVG